LTDKSIDVSVSCGDAGDPGDLVLHPGKMFTCFAWDAEDPDGLGELRGTVMVTVTYTNPSRGIYEYVYTAFI
jgi:hypothetical protein